MPLTLASLESWGYFSDGYPHNYMLSPQILFVPMQSSPCVCSHVFVLPACSSQPNPPAHFSHVFFPIRSSLQSFHILPRTFLSSLRVPTYLFLPVCSYLHILHHGSYLCIPGGFVPMHSSLWVPAYPFFPTGSHLCVLPRGFLLTRSSPRVPLANSTISRLRPCE